MESPNPNNRFPSNADVSETKGQHKALQFECKYCSTKYPNVQALCGHMNAHKFERAMEKAARDALANQIFPVGAVMDRPVQAPMYPMINHHRGLDLGYPLNPNYYHPLIPGLNNDAGAVVNSNFRPQIPAGVVNPRIVPSWPLVLTAARAPAQLVARPRVGMSIMNNNNDDGNNAHHRGGGGRAEENFDQPMADASGLDLTLRLGYANRD